MKKRLILVVAGVMLALSPAAAGAIGNTSLSHRVPVSGPTATTGPGDDRAVTAPPSPTTSGTSASVGHDAGDDRGGLVPRDQRAEPGDDRDAATAPATAGAPAPSAAATSAATADPGASRPADDDHGGLVARDQRTEPGDDRSGDATGRGGDDDGTGHDASDDHGGSGHGGDDA